jgi:hypothetical protein
LFYRKLRKRTKRFAPLRGIHAGWGLPGSEARRLCAFGRAAESLEEEPKAIVKRLDIQKNQLTNFQPFTH